MTTQVISAAAAAVVPSAIDRVLTVGRGGATILAAAGATSLVQPYVKRIRGGGRLGKGNPPKNTDVKGPLLTAEGKSVLCMATGMALHYLGYSLARSITVALFTSASTGYPGSPGAFPFAMAFVSPVSLLLLMGYGTILERHGPRVALTQSTLFCASILMAASGAIEACERSGAVFYGIPAMKFLTAPLFIFRESYVQLLTSQYWSFMASVLTPNQSAKWFAPM